MSKTFTGEHSRTREGAEDLAKALVDEGGNVSEVCRSLGISRTTYYEWEKDFPDILEGAKREARSNTCDELREIALLKARSFVDRDQARMIEMLLRAYDPDFMIRQAIDHTSKGESVNRTWIIVDPPEPDDNE